MKTPLGAERRASGRFEPYRTLSYRPPSPPQETVRAPVNVAPARPTEPQDAGPSVTAAVPEDADRPGWLAVYTDGACTYNGDADARAGVGVWFGVEDPRNICERCPGWQTNNRAELLALIRALETIADLATPILLKTDSQYCIDAVLTCPLWKERDWRKTDGTIVRNWRLVRYLTLLLDLRASLGQRVELRKVAAHRGVPGNEAADVLSKVGALLPAKREPDWFALGTEIEKCFPEYWEGVIVKQEDTSDEVAIL